MSSQAFCFYTCNSASEQCLRKIKANRRWDFSECIIKDLIKFLVQKWESRLFQDVHSTENRIGLKVPWRPSFKILLWKNKSFLRRGVRQQRRTQIHIPLQWVPRKFSQLFLHEFYFLKNMFHNQHLKPMHPALLKHSHS